MRTVGPTVARLRQLSLFATCSEKELQFIARRGIESRSAAGAVLLQEGRSGHQFVVIAQGSAVVSIGGREVARLGPGECCGEVALLDHGDRTASVVAETALLVWVCSAQEFAEIIDSCPTLVRRLLGVLAERTRSTYRQQQLRPTTERAGGCALI